MSDTLTARAFLKKVNTFFNSFDTDVEASKSLGIHKQFITQLRKGIRPAPPRVLEVMGYEVEVIRPPIRRIYRKKM